MSRTELLKLVEANDQSSDEHRTRAMAVWAKIVQIEPELASEILQLFATDDAAAEWVVGSPNERECSPARHIAQDRAALVLSRVRSIAHGFGA